MVKLLEHGIGPGSNSHFINLGLYKPKYISFAIEIIGNDNDWFYKAFEEAYDFRRYWKDYNFHIIRKEFKNVFSSFSIIFNRSLNYQWELDDYETPYYPGRDINNFSFNLDLIYKF